MGLNTTTDRLLDKLTKAIDGLDTTQASTKTATEKIDDAIHVDDAAFTLGTHSGMMMMGFAGTQDVNANDAGAVAMDVQGSLCVKDVRSTAPHNTVHLTGTKAFTGPFYAITALTETVIDASEGDTNIVESDDSGSMQDLSGTLTIPAGVTIYGNFAVVELDSGTAIGYAERGVTVAVAGS